MFYKLIRVIIAVINKAWSLLDFLWKYRPIFSVTGFFTTRKFKEAKHQYRYAVMVAARNEETVIGNLIDSIRKQDYPSELVDIFVVADNCTDNTAKIARELGAYCYERFDSEHRTKGFAIQYLVECIRRDHGIEKYDGYFLFDADNLLKSDYITRMNESFDSGEKIITSYRNTKNFDDNWIAASYGIHWLRTVRSEHRAKSVFRLATRIQGTGFLFANELIKDGWNYTSLTEDRAFCADAVANGYKISFNNAAEFYDEQPVSMKVAMRQRIRWAKGHLQAFVTTGPKLFAHIFVTHNMANKRAEEQGKQPSRFKRIINDLRLRFMSFDMLTLVFPKALLSAFKKIIVYALRVILIVGVDDYIGLNFAPKVMAEFMRWLNIVPSKASPAVIMALWLSLFTFAWTVYSFFKCMLSAAYVFIMERKRIMHIKWYKKVWYCITFPLFDVIGRLATIIALFSKVEWKPIPHNADINISQIETH